ncbi:MAG: NmrA/HSCARG family protein [Saprospiraceae bacterium]|nr:NmrA/HSCARG family protein [Saprospiraceae bacterium]
MEKKIIAVVGATGLQGKGVVNALTQEGSFKVRAITRSPEKYNGHADEVVQGDLANLESLRNAFEGAHGVFVVTNFWEGADEIAQGKVAIQAANDAGVNHFVWSTLPDVEKISNGQFDVPHFTGKAKVDEIIKNAGFENYTFVQPPFYFQNFTGIMGPQPKEDGSTGWILPIDPGKKVIHMADINDLGKVVAGAFLAPEKVGKGSYLSLASDLYSFNDVLAAYKSIGKQYSFTQVPGEVFSNFFQGAGEIAQMLAYFEKYTYMGPGAESQIGLANAISIGEFTPLNEWIKQNAQ